MVPGIGGAGLLIKLVWAWFREKLFHLSLYKYKRTAPLTSSDYSLCFSGCVFPFGALKSLFKIRYLSVGRPLPIVSCRYLFINSNRAEKWTYLLSPLINVLMWGNITWLFHQGQLDWTSGDVKTSSSSDRRKRSFASTILALKIINQRCETITHAISVYISPSLLHSSCCHLDYVYELSVINHRPTWKSLLCSQHV